MASKHDVDTGQAWVVLAGSSMGMSILALVYCGGVFNIMFLEVFGKSKQETAWLTAVQSSLLSLWGPLSGVLMTRLGGRWTTIAGGVVGSLGYILTFFANGYTYAFITFSLMSGAGFGICYVPLITIPSMYFDKRLNLAYGLTTTALAVGTVTLPALLLLLRDHFGWRGTMLIIGGLYMHMILAGSMFKRRTPLEDTDSLKHSTDMNDDSKIDSVCDVHIHRENGLRNNQEEISSSLEISSIHSIVQGTPMKTIEICTSKHSLRFMSNPPFLCLCVSLFAVNAASFSCYIHFPAYFVTKGASTTSISTCFLALGLCNVACRLIAGIATNSKDIEVVLVYISSCGLTGVLMFMCPLRFMDTVDACL